MGKLVGLSSFSGEASGTRLSGDRHPFVPGGVKARPPTYDFGAFQNKASGDRHPFVPGLSKLPDLV